jgi:polyphenol oxidase
MTQVTVRQAGGVTVVQSAILESSNGVVHAFSTRQGGVSKPPFAALNLGQSVGDDRTSVEENRRRFFGGFGIAGMRVVRAKQVHGNGVLRVDAKLIGRTGFPYSLADEPAEFDALITNLPGLALVVSTADCLPILIHDPVRRAVAAVHAGWRGTAKRIAVQALAAMREAYRTEAGDCRAAIGPGIRRCCFEVDAVVTEVMAGALPNWGRHATANRAGHWLLDIAGINRALLEAAGVGADRIEDVELCTSCRNDLFFSHRAEKGRTGRMMNFILLEEEDRQGQRKRHGTGRGRG